VAVRADLSPGLAAAQAVHAGIEFSLKHPSITTRWHRDSNNLVVVAVPNEAAVLMLESMAFALGLRHRMVTEPDVEDQATAIALEPGLFSQRLCASYPLALKERGTVGGPGLDAPLQPSHTGVAV
jgi:peptidyl-tRNA hydrolase